MTKNILILFVAIATILSSCKKESLCSERGSYNVTGFELQINSENIGLFKDEGANTTTTISSTRNQWMFIPSKSFIASTSKRDFSFDFFTTAYAKDCIVLENSLTSFDNSKTVFSIDRDLDLSIYGLAAGIVPAGTNLLSVADLKSDLLQAIVSNTYLHSGLETPISVSKDFLLPLDGEQITFKLEIISSTGIKMSSSVSVVIDVNA